MTDKKYVDIKRSTRDPKPLLRHVASLRAWPHQGGHPADMIALEIEAAFGTQTISQGKQSFQFKLKRCFIDVSLENCSVLKDPPKYRRSLADDDYKIAITKLKETAASAEVSGKAKLGISLPDILDFLKLDASVGGEASKHNEDKRTTEVVINRKIQIVEALASDRWQIGHDTLGDPLNDGFLAGDYLRPIPDGSPAEDVVGGQTVLCGLCLDAGRSELKVIVELRALMGDF